MSDKSRKDSSWSFNSEEWENVGNNDPQSAVYAVYVKEKVKTGTYQPRGMACCVMLKVGGKQVVYFVTSSDLETDKKQAHLFPCSAQKTEGCQLVVDSTDKFWPFSFLSFDRGSSPGLKGNPSLTCLDFQVPKQNLESEFEAYTLVGTNRLLKVKFEYQRVTGKYIFSAKKKAHQEQPFVLGAPIIIKNKEVTKKQSSSRWPVVGVMGLDEKQEFCPYFVTADIFEQVNSASGSEGRGASTSGSADSFATTQIDREEDFAGSSNSSGDAYASGGSAVFRTTENCPTDTELIDKDSRGIVLKVEFYEKSLNFAKEAGDRPAEAKAYYNLGSAYYSLRDFPKAIEYYQESLRIAREAGDQDTEKKSYQSLMNASTSHEDLPKAIERFKKNLNTAREAGDRAAEGKASYDLGTIYFSANDFPEALKCYEKSVHLAREAGNRTGVILGHFGIGMVYFRRRDFEKAVKCFEESVKMAEEAGNYAHVRRVSPFIAESYLVLGNSVKAEQVNSAGGSGERDAILHLASTSQSTAPEAAVGLPARATSQRIRGGGSMSEIPLKIAVQPQSQTKKEGSRVELRCEATGNELSYSWLKDGQEIEGQRGCCLVFEQVSMADFGSYVCQVEKKDQRCSSEVAELDVTPGDGKSYTYLSNLPMDVEEMVGKELSLELGGKKAWKFVADYYKMDRTNINLLKKEFKLPGVATLGHIKAVAPDLTVYNFCKTLKQHNIRRLDIVQKLKGHLSS